MLRRAKSFFIKRKKNDPTEVEPGLPVEFLSEKAHLARKPIIVDPDKRLITFREPPDRPDLNTVVRSHSRLHEIREKEENGGSDFKPGGFRRKSRPKTIDVPPGRSSRLSFPPLRKEEKKGDWLEEIKGKTGSKKSVNQ